MKRILFVDDDLNVLDGLQRMLRSQRNEWSMEFVPSGQEALTLLSVKSFDVVVSDMRMPVMDGNNFLTQVMKNYPNIVRIILSGHTDIKMTLKSVKIAHQYLTKPCDPEILKATVERSCALRNLLNNSTLKNLLSGIDNLPSLPTLYNEIMEELHAKDPSIKKIAKIISQDIGMTAKILHLVNSSFFGLNRHIVSTEQAAVYLGLDTISGLVLSIQIFSQFDQSQIHGFSIEKLWRHSSIVGTFARIITREEKCEQKMIDDAFMAGLLHDIGKLVLATKTSELYKKALSLAQDKCITLWEAEKTIFGTTHAEAGAYLLSIWGIPDSIVEALAFHHCPQKCPNQEAFTLAAVHAANVLEHESAANGVENPTMSFDLDYMDKAGLSNRISSWIKLCITAGQGDKK